VEPIRDLLQRLRDTQGDTRAQAALTAEFLVVSRPDEERGPLRAVLDAAAVLHWFDAELLVNVLETPDEDARRFEGLKEYSFVERYRGETDERYNLHESTRLGWRTKLARERPERFRALSATASSCFANDASPAGRIEWIYHLLSADPDLGASELEELDRQWTGTARSEDRYTLATALQELEETQLLEGRARAHSLLAIAWTRNTRGEISQLAQIATEALRLARESQDESAEADARCLAGDVLQAQGQLAAAQAAFAEFLGISRRLTEQDPSNAGWQRELAWAHSRVGDVLQAQGKLAAAQAAFDEHLAISRRLAEQDPSNAGWQRDLAMVYGRIGGVLQVQGQLAAAQTAFAENLCISRRLAEQDPSNAGWQRELAWALARVGDVLQAQGKLAEAQAAFDETRAISRRLAEQDPSNAGWQSDLAVALARVGDVLQAQGKLAEAQGVFSENLAISRRLAEQDPSNAGWQQDLAWAHSRVGNVLQAQGELTAALGAFVENLAISRRLVQQDPSNAGWQRGLALACLRIARIAAAAGVSELALPLYEESFGIFANLVERAPGFVEWAEDMKTVEVELTALRRAVAPSPEARG
jgi:tetratricopeptide (TPR) repeat protein